MEEALRQSEEKFRKAFYTSPDSMAISRLEDGMYISINPGFTKGTKYTEEDIIGKTSIEYNIWDNVENRQRWVDRLKRDGEVINLEATFRRKGGEIRYGLVSASVIDLMVYPIFSVLPETLPSASGRRRKSEDWRSACNVRIKWRPSEH